MFRLQNNVPEYYMNNSRDFQLLVRLLEVVQGSTSYSIHTLAHATNTRECNSSLLPLLATKLGLFVDFDIPDHDFRMVLDAFPTIIRHKGTRVAVQYVVTLFRRMMHDTTSETRIRWGKDYGDYYDNNVVEIIFENKVRNVQLLYRLLEYILPTGYVVIVRFMPTKAPKEGIVTSDRVSVAEVMPQELTYTEGDIPTVNTSVVGEELNE